jgi:hypothetical protein
MENRPRQYRPESEKPKSTDPPKPESTLNRAVERTRDLYERNGWVFLPLGESAKISSSSSNLEGERGPQPEPQEHANPKAESGLSKLPEEKKDRFSLFSRFWVCTLRTDDFK